MLPESWTARIPYLAALEDDWRPFARWAAGAWIAFYSLFLLQAARGRGPLLAIDLVFVPIHEGGHALFSYFGRFMMVAGGTFLQLFVPFALAVYFLFRRQVAGTAFCAFFFFEQFLPVGAYMADARAQELPLVTIGDPDLALHDWFYLFNRFGVLPHDTQIGRFVRVLGWMGMFATVVWLAWRAFRRSPAPSPSPSA